jgi:predicted nucleic acid-binding protein
MAGKAFVDTNILLRATNAQFPFHEQALALTRSEIQAGTELWISRQIVREYLHQSTRPQSFMNAMPIEQVEAEIARIRMLFRIADETEAVMEQLLILIKKYPTGGKQVHDARSWRRCSLMASIPCLRSTSVTLSGFRIKSSWSHFLKRN